MIHDSREFCQSTSPPMMETRHRGDSFTQVYAESASLRTGVKRGLFVCRVNYMENFELLGENLT
jgi:hypothetical protein